MKRFFCTMMVLVLLACGIGTALANSESISLDEYVDYFNYLASKQQYVHNLNLDKEVVSHNMGQTTHRLDTGKLIRVHFMFTTRQNDREILQLQMWGDLKAGAGNRLNDNEVNEYSTALIETARIAELYGDIEGVDDMVMRLLEKALKLGNGAYMDYGQKEYKILCTGNTWTLTIKWK